MQRTPAGLIVGLRVQHGHACRWPSVLTATPHASSAVQVSAFVRAVLYDPEMRLNGGSVIAYDPCPSAGVEASLLNSVLDLYSKGILPGGLQDIGEDMVRGLLVFTAQPVCMHAWQTNQAVCLHFRPTCGQISALHGGSPT